MAASDVRHCSGEAEGNPLISPNAPIHDPSIVLNMRVACLAGLILPVHCDFDLHLITYFQLFQI